MINNIANRKISLLKTMYLLQKITTLKNVLKDVYN